MKTTPAEALPGGRKQPGLDSFGSRCSSAVAISLNVSLIILDPLYSTHDQDENDTRAMAALALQRPPRPSVVRSGHPRLSWGNCSLSCHSPTPRLPCFRWRRTTWIFSKRISTVERALQRPPRPSVVRSGHPRLSWGNFSPKPRELQLALKLTF